MLSKTLIAKFAALAKIKEADLEAAIKDTEEKEIALPDGLESYTPAEKETLVNNEYKRGKTSGIEMAVKETKEKIGLDFQGKTIDGLLEAHSKKVLSDAQLQPDAKVAELEGKLKTVQATAQEYQTKAAMLEDTLQNEKITFKLLQHIPQFGENAPALSGNDVINLMKINGYSFKQDGEKIIANKDGSVMTDKLSNPLSVKDVVTGFLKEKNFITEEITPGGRGGGNQQSAFKAGKLSELQKQWEDSGKNILGEEFGNAVKAAQKENPDFDLNS